MSPTSIGPLTAGALALIALAGCDVFAPDTVELSGTVTIDGEPAAGFVVVAAWTEFGGEYPSSASRATTTDDGGRYTLTVNDCQVWLHAVVVVTNLASAVVPPKGHYDGSEVCAGHARYDWELVWAPAWIMGVAYSWGNRLSGGAVAAENVGGDIRTVAPIDTTGSFYFDSLPRGDYVFTVTEHAPGVTFDSALHRTLVPGRRNTYLEMRGRPNPKPSFVSVHARGHSACAVSDGGDAYCWDVGAAQPPAKVRGDVHWVELDGNCGLSNTQQAYCFGSGTATLVEGGHVWTSVAQSGEHACGVTVTGALYCWGYLRPPPDVRPVAYGPDRVGAGVAWRTVDVGYQLACGVTADSLATCWSLADSQRLSPRPVPGGHQWVGVSVGRAHACGIVVSREAYCWGEGRSGQLGIGSALTRTDVPVLVVGGHSWSFLDAGGDHHTCGLVASGEPHCWGANTGGQVGNLSSEVHLSPVPASYAGTGWAQLSVGAAHSCGVNATGKLMCWGRGRGVPGAVGDNW